MTTPHKVTEKTYNEEEAKGPRPALDDHETKDRSVTHDAVEREAAVVKTCPEGPERGATCENAGAHDVEQRMRFNMEVTVTPWRDDLGSADGTIAGYSMLDL